MSAIPSASSATSDRLVAALVRRADPAGEGDQREQPEQPGGEPLGDRTGAAEVGRRGRRRAPAGRRCSAATLSMSSSLNEPNDGIAPGPTRIASPISVGVDSIRSGASRAAADRRAGAGRDVAGGAVEPVQLAAAARSPAVGSTSGMAGPSPNAPA